MNTTNPHHPETIAWALWEGQAALAKARGMAALVVERCGDTPNMQELARAHRIADLRLLEVGILTELR